MCDVVVPDDVEEQCCPVQDGRRVHEQDDHEESGVWRLMQAVSPGQEDKLASLDDDDGFHLHKDQAGEKYQGGE